MAEQKQRKHIERRRCRICRRAVVLQRTKKGDGICATCRDREREAAQ